MQTAFLFIKPHAVNPTVAEYVEQRLLSDGYIIEAFGFVPCDVIARDNLAVKHYGTLAQRALSIPPTKLPRPDDNVLQKFVKEYGISFDDACTSGRLCNVTDYLENEKNQSSSSSSSSTFDPFEFEKEWRSSTCLKLFPGTYCSIMTNKLIVVNGFFPAMQAKYEKIEYAPNGIQFFLISFDSKKIHWKDFREQFIGATNPKKAVEGSLRHYLYHNYESMDLATQPAGSDNGIHASASPVEAGMFLTSKFFCFEYRKT